MYLYFLHDYDTVFEIHLPDIFEDGNQVIDLPSLFADNSTHPPNKPIITNGPGSGRINTQYECSSIGSDDDNDGLFYYFDYGDGSNSGWIGHYNSGEECTVTHSWAQQGNYEIKVKTKDIFGFESDWSEPLQISMPRYKISSLFKFNDTYTDFPSVVTFILMLLAGFK
jgi:hypothetical protein